MKLLRKTPSTVYTVVDDDGTKYLIFDYRDTQFVFNTDLDGPAVELLNPERQEIIDRAPLADEPEHPE